MTELATAADPRTRRTRKRPQRRLLWTVLVLAALGLLIWGAWTLVHSTGKGTPGAFGQRGGRPSTTVGVAAAASADVPINLDALGTVTPTATITVRPQVSGVITQVLFTEGQMVKRGQALAIIDPRPLKMALLQAQGNLQRDEAQLENARLLLSRDRTLLAQDSIARQDVDTQAATVKQLAGVVVTDRAAVGAAQLNLGYSRVVAPVAGRVGLRAIDVGNYIAAGDANGLVVLTQVAPIDVQFAVPQDQAQTLMQRSHQATLPVTALDRSRTTTLAQGTFSTLDNQVDTTTGTVRAKARFTNGDGALFPSQFVNVRVQVDTLHDAVTVPVTAVRTGPNGDFVWLLNADKTVTMQAVKRGPTTATVAVVLSGLKAGEKVVTEGGDRLTDGAKVMLPGDRPTGGGRGGRGGAGAGAAGQAGAPGAHRHRRGAGAPGGAPAAGQAPAAGGGAPAGGS